jgi:hypothetical protein
MSSRLTVGVNDGTKFGMYYDIYSRIKAGYFFRIFREDVLQPY